jgi:predicted aspartyl protease
MLPTPKKTLLVLCLFGLTVSLTTSISQATPAAPTDTLFTQGKFEQAQQLYTTAILSAPGDIAPRLGLIRTLLRLDHWPEARAAAQEAVSKFPSSADAHGLLALTLIRAGWQPSYADEAKQALALDPGNYWGLVASGRAADWDGNTPEARRRFRQASAAHPELPDAWLGLLQTLDSKGDAKEKSEVVKTYFQLTPQGQPHDREREILEDLRRNYNAYLTGFGNDPPYRRVLHETGSKPSSERAAIPTAIKVDFVGDYAAFPVIIQGKPFHLLFDTGGGNEVTLNAGAARKLGLPVLAHSYIRGVAGKEDSEVYKADSMTLGNLSYRSIAINTMSSSPRDMDGILGGNILHDSVVTLDYENRTALLAQEDSASAPPPLPGDRSLTLPFRAYHGHLYVSVLLNTMPLWALLDTGDEVTILSLRLAREQLKNTPKSEIRSGTTHTRHGIGNNPTQFISSRDESKITLSTDPPVAIPMPTIGVSDLDEEISPGSDFEIGMLLGVSSLTYAHRLTFDYPHRLLTFEYRAPDAVKPAKNDNGSL